MPSNPDASRSLARLISASALVAVTAACAAGIAVIPAAGPFPDLQFVGTLLGGIFPVAGWVLGRDVAGLTHLRGRGNLIVLGLVVAFASVLATLGMWVDREVHDVMFAWLIPAVVGSFAAPIALAFVLPRTDGEAQLEVCPSGRRPDASST